MSVESGLSATDRSLLRSVFQWARANGWIADPGGHGLHHWCGPTVHLTVDQLADWVLTVSPIASTSDSAQVRPKSVTEAVDVLVALGALPAHFSSVYNGAFAEGMAALKDVAVTLAVDAELDQRCARLKEAAPDLAAEHGHLLRAEAPYDRREAMASILNSAWEVVDADL